MDSASPITRGLAILAVLGALVFSGCATNDDEASTATARTNAQGAASGGALSSDPEPVTLRQVEQLPAGSPQRVVMRLWFWAQWGSAPDIIDEYDPAVRQAVDAATIISSYAFQRQSLLASQPEIVSSRTEGDRGFVALQVRRRDLPATRESFSLRRSAGRWRIVYDTLLDKLIPAYIQSRYKTDPNDKPTEKARQIADFQVRNFRSAFLQDEGTGTVPPP